MSTLIIYTLRYINDDNKHFLNNFLNFVNNGGYYKNKNIKYYLIYNNNTLNIDIKLPKNFNILLKKLEPDAWLMWKYVIDNININDYKYFCLIKDTIYGPYMKNWIDEFKKLITDSTKLVGTTINLFPIRSKKNIFLKPHVQSRLLFFDDIALKLIENNNVFNYIKKGHINKEIYLSKIILDNNYNINCLEKNNCNKNYIKYNKLNINFTKEQFHIIRKINYYNNNFLFDYYNNIFITKYNQEFDILNLHNQINIQNIDYSYKLTNIDEQIIKNVYNLLDNLNII